MTSSHPGDEFADDARNEAMPGERVEETDVHTTEIVSPASTEAGAEYPAGDSGRHDGDGTQRPAATSSPISAGMWIALIVSALLLVLLLVFIVQNNVPAEIHYFGFAFTLPLGVTVLLSAIAGVLIAGIIGSVRIFIVNRKYKQVTHRR